jgi:hypothetical protein
MHLTISGLFFLVGGGGGLSQLLENHIKNELIENSQLVHALTSFEESKSPSSEPRKSASIACGASVFEVSMKVPTWASQVMLSHILPIYSYSKKKKKKSQISFVDISIDGWGEEVALIHG